MKGLRPLLSVPISLLLLPQQAEAGTELTWKNWEKRTEGKPVFALFTSTGDDCPSFCKEIEETWSKLMEVWDDEDHQHAVVAMVDCHGKGKKICQKMELVGKIPNMRHGWGGKAALKPGGLRGYAGSRMEDSLKEWADQYLVKGLTPGEEFVPVNKDGQPTTQRKMSAKDVERLKGTASATLSPQQYEELMGKGSAEEVLKAANAQKEATESKKARRRRRSRRRRGDSGEEL
eukprot:TRINITY_DN17833_c0_g1_i1.p1 TRINITY_DN17833_c0_g1~~TRINITY_DN17833_c0_g1_i1.p1  ORF type:complete len:232 (+),score=69.62 TRINITY_DN17833_c0_g1_i1:94-789(+)